MFSRWPAGWQAEQAEHAASRFVLTCSPLSLIFSLGSSRDPSQPQVGAAELWHRDTSILESLLPPPDLDSSEAPALEVSLNTGITPHHGLLGWYAGASRWSWTPKLITFRRCCCNSMAGKEHLSFLQMSAPGGVQNDLCHLLSFKGSSELQSC